MRITKIPAKIERNQAEVEPEQREQEHEQEQPEPEGMPEPEFLQNTVRRIPGELDSRRFNDIPIRRGVHNPSRLNIDNRLLDNGPEVFEGTLNWERLGVDIVQNRGRDATEWEGGLGSQMDTQTFFSSTTERGLMDPYSRNELAGEENRVLSRRADMPN